MIKAHETLVEDQFGDQAQAYVASTVHAQGADLEYVTAIALARGGGRALDLGCGGGHVSYRLAMHMTEVVAYDLSQKMLGAVMTEAATRGLANITAQQGVAERLPFESARFDLVATRYSAHHWSDLDLALHEARRVLKSGGRALFVDIVPPAAPLLDTHLQSIELLRDLSHVRDYSVSEWVSAIGRAGFTAKTMSVLPTRIDFTSWITRMRTPDIHVQAIRALQQLASVPIREAFLIEPDGSFTMSTMVLEAV